MSAFVSAYADEETRRALRAEYASCTCGWCTRAKPVDFPWPEDAEQLDRDATGALPNATVVLPNATLELPSLKLYRHYVWCDYVGGLVTKSRPVYTDEDGECPMYEEE